METAYFFYLIIAVFSALMLMAAYSDLCEYRIPNTYVLALLALYPAYYFASPYAIDFIWSLGIGIGFFLFGAFLFSAGFMGGGDVKLIAVSALWVGLPGMVSFVFFMSLCGAGMALFMLSRYSKATAYICGRLGLESAHQKLMTPKLPYGVAIAFGALAAMFNIISVSM